MLHHQYDGSDLFFGLIQLSLSIHTTNHHGAVQGQGSGGLGKCWVSQIENKFRFDLKNKKQNMNNSWVILSNHFKMGLWVAVIMLFPLYQ